jgi:signal transduction histidine kinase
LNTSQALHRFGALSRLMNVGVILLDTAVGVEFLNPIAGDLLGAAGEDEAKTRWTALKRQVGLDAQRIAAAPSPMRFLVDFPGAAGTRSLRLEIHTLRHSECEGYLVLLRDRKAVDALEASLLLASQTRSAVHVNRALAHDLRAPLNSMQLTLDLLADSLASEGGSDGRRAEQRERHVAILREELTRLSEIVRSALDRGESTDPAPQLFDLREVLREANRLLGPQARRQHVDVDLRLPERPVILTGYRDRIKQALINLTLDGLESMPDGGRLAIELAAERGMASATIRGSGGGAHSLDDIYRIHATGGAAVGALGIYVARVIAESHGGEIEAEGEPGHGLYFRLMLPLDERQAAAGAAAGRARHS